MKLGNDELTQGVWLVAAGTGYLFASFFHGHDARIGVALIVSVVVSVIGTAVVAEWAWRP